MKTNLMFALIGAVFGAALLYLLFWPEVSETTVVKEETVWIPYYDTIPVPKDSLVLKIVDVKPSVEPEKYDSIRTYKGVERFEYGSFEWEARALGSLDFLQFKPNFNIPTTYITKETTKAIKHKGLYAQAWVSTNDMIPALGATYINNRLILSYKYTPLTKDHSVSAGVRIF